MESKEKIYLIDGSSYVYRAFYALPSLTDSRGFPTNAIYGFTNMLRKLIKENKPDYLAVAFDHKAPTFRHKRFEEYKITRKPTPELLKRQLPILKEIIQDYGIAIFEIPGYEADDILAYIAIKAKDSDFQIYIVSSDKDVLQMVGNEIYVYNPQKEIIFDDSKVKDVYGIKPSYFADFLALSGDAIDNIPGITGIGEKTAKELVRQFGHVEEIIKNMDNLPTKLKSIIENKKEQLLLSKELAKINFDIECDINIEELKLKRPCYQKLIPKLEALELQTLVKELLEEIDSDIEINYHQINDAQSLLELIKKIQSESKFTFYLLGIDDSIKLSIALEGILYLISEDLLQKNKDSINKVFQDKKIEKISYNLKDIIKLLRKYELNVLSPTFDIQIIAYLLNPSWQSYDLAKIVTNYLESGFEIASNLIKVEESKLDFTRKILLYCYAIDKVYSPLKSKLKESNLMNLYYEIEEPLVFVLSDMEERGIAMDVNYLRELQKEYQIKLKKLAQEIYAQAKCVFNLNSPKQVREILYKKLKLKPSRKGKTGPSTDERTLRNLSTEHPLPGLILRYRELNKTENTYIDGLLSCVDPRTLKIHTTFNQTITQTGRLSCSNPNLQAIPIRSELGRQIRKAFIPSEQDYLFLSADYSQIELRILAHLSGDERLITAFRKGKDIHRHTAGLIFGVDEDLVSEEMRNIAKTVNFGIIYGISSFGLSQQLNIPPDKAGEFIKYYFELYPMVKIYIDKVINIARKEGYVSTLFNRIRYLPEINALDTNVREFGERLAINTPIQGSAADIIKKVMVDIVKEIKFNKLKAHLLLQIHDELLFEVSKKNLDLLKRIVIDKMENVLTFAVPLVVNLKVGYNWLELNKNKLVRRVNV